jgi:hypothetical protein
MGYYNHWILNQQEILNNISKIKKTRERAKIVANSQARARTLLERLLVIKQVQKDSFPG